MDSTVTSPAAPCTWNTRFARPIRVERMMVDRSLAEMRAYRAGMGHLNYALCRLRRAGQCGSYWGTCVTDSTSTPTLIAYMDEVTARRRFQYPEELPECFVQIAPMSLPDDLPDKHLRSFHLLLIVNFSEASIATTPLLTRLMSQMCNIVVRICVVSADATACGNALTTGAGGSGHGDHRIKTFRWANP